MFSRNSKKPTKPADSQAAAKKPEDLKQIFQDAVDRNTSIGIVRLGHSGQDPLAMGRMLEWIDGEVLVLEQLQIIGHDIMFNVGSRVEAFVKFNDTILMFEAEIEELDHATRLNENRVVRSLKLRGPHLLRRGDRRSSFRSSVTASGTDTPVEMWFLDRVVEEIPKEIVQGKGAQKSTTYYTDLQRAKRLETLFPEPENEDEVVEINWPEIIEKVEGEDPHAVGRLADLTANGLGFIMYGVAKMQLNRFERLAARFEVEGEPLDVVVEIRHAVDLKGSTCRVGCLIVHPKIGCVHAPQRRMLEKRAMEIQREQLRIRKSA